MRDAARENGLAGMGGFFPGGRVSADGTEFIQELPSSLDLFKVLIGFGEPDPQESVRIEMVQGEAWQGRGPEASTDVTPDREGSGAKRLNAGSPMR